MLNINFSANFVNRNVSNDTLKVGAIWDAEKVPNIKQGDKIIAIDHIKCKELDRCALLFLTDYMSKCDSLRIITEDKTRTQHSTYIKQE